MRVINYDALWSKIGEYAKRVDRWFPEYTHFEIA